MGELTDSLAKIILNKDFKLRRKNLCEDHCRMAFVLNRVLELSVRFEAGY